jgi:hypothetical protein
MRALPRRLARARLPRLMLAVAILAAPAALSLPAAKAASSLPAAKAAASRPSAPQAVTQTSQTRCVTANGGATCTGTYGGDRAFNPNWSGSWPPPPPPTPPDKQQFPANRPPTVTVDQTTNLTDQVVHVRWSNFTPSLTSDGNPAPGMQIGGAIYHVAIYQCRGWNPPSVPPSYFGFAASNDCYKYAFGDPNASQGPANATVTYTSANGTGQADFHIEAGQQRNSFLNCDAHSPCSLVVVPNWGGIEPDTNQTDPPAAHCADHSNDAQALTTVTPTGTDDQIGFVCSWADRIVVPLSFLQSPTDCPITSSTFQPVGSPMLERAMLEWIPGWCRGRNAAAVTVPVSTDEYSARSEFLSPPVALTASVDMALASRPPYAAAVQASSRKFTYAPLAVSGIAISYYIDDRTTGQPITNLVLNARLVAKLLTQSYSLLYDCTQPPGPPQDPPPAASSRCDPAVAHNPTSIFNDPEFLNLNGGNTPSNRARFPRDNETQFGDFLPIVVSGNSDMTYELTRWVVSDPAARAFLQGQADPWGMRVNNKYWNIAYPVDQFLPLDPGMTFNPFATNAPGGAAQNSFIETMQASWNPMSGLDNIGTALITAQPNGNNPTCVTTISVGGVSGSQCQVGSPYGVARLPAEPVGSRDVTAVLDEGQAAVYRFPTARLVNAAGQAVAPTAASMSAARRDMQTNPDKITQYADFTSTDPKAYPLTMVDYAMVPTCGLSASKASAIAAFLHHVTSGGQQYGVQPGQLAPGYLALDSAQRTQTNAAAAAVAAQTCTSPPPDTTVSGGTPSVSQKAPAGPGAGSTPAASTPAASTPAKAGAHGPGSGRTPGSGANGHTLAYGTKDGGPSGLMSWLLPLVMSLGGLLILGGPAAYVIHVTGTWPVIYRRLRGIGGQLAGLVGRA